MDPKERGEPVTIKVKGLSELAEGLQKAAGIEAMGERGGMGYRLPCRWIPAPLELLLEGSRVP